MTPPRALAAAGVSAGGNPGKDVGASLRGASGTPPPTVCPGMGGGGSLPLIRPCGATFPQGGRQGLLLAAAQASAGRRGRRPLRVARRRAAAQASAGRRGRRPLRLAREGRRREAAPHPALRGHLPPRGKARVVVEGFIPPGGLAAGEAAAGWGHPALRMGIWKRPRGLRGHPFPGRRAVGAGHARPGGWREHPSMVRSVGRGLDPSAGVGGSGSLRGW